MAPAWACGARELHFPESIEVNPSGGRGGLGFRVTTALPKQGSPSPEKRQRLRSSVKALSARGPAGVQPRDPLPALPSFLLHLRVTAYP